MKNCIIILFILSFFAVNGCGNNSDGGSEDEISNSIVATIIVHDLPDKLTINFDSTPDNYVEYQWVVVFDVDDDGIESEGDIVFRIVQYKRPGDVQSVVNFQDLKASADVYFEIEGNLRLRSLGSIEVESSDNALTFIADRGMSDQMLLIDYQTQIRVITYKHIENKITTDGIPSANLDDEFYTNVSDNRIVIDVENDYYGDDINFDILQFELEIFE